MHRLCRVPVVLVLALPGGAYRLELATGAGDVDLDGVHADAEVDAALRRHTGAGDIVVAGG